MLGSIDPIIIFQLYKLVPDTSLTKAKIPIVSEVKKKITVGIIPIYLSEQITGLYIDSESKNIDIDTNVESLSSGDAALVNQKTLGSITSVNLIGKRDSIGLTILLALAEQILDKATSAEYEMTYMHGATVVFGGLIHGLSIDQSADNDLVKIKLEISRGRAKSKSVVVGEDPSAERLQNQGTLPAAGAAKSSGAAGGGTSVIVPGRG